MKAGLFLCDHVNPEYREQFGDYSDMFVALFPELEWTFYDACGGEFPDDFSECEVYFSTGSRRSVYEEETWIEKMKSSIREIAKADKYFVGFCFGHQLLAEAMGGKVQPSPRGWCVGVHEFDIFESTLSPDLSQGKINLLMMCGDQVAEVPKGVKVLAGNEKCPVGIMQVGSKLLGVQAHPEFTKAYDKVLMELRADRIGVETVELGLKSLDLPVHRAEIRNYVLNFIGAKG